MLRVYLRPSFDSRKKVGLRCRTESCKNVLCLWVLHHEVRFGTRFWKKLERENW